MRQRIALAVIAGSAVLVLLAGFVVVTRIQQDNKLDAGLRQVVQIGCDRDVTTISQLRTIIQRGRDNARRYYEEGVITREQYERAVAENDRALRVLALPDCKASLILISP